jgi:hypothetical protein
VGEEKGLDARRGRPVAGDADERDLVSGAREGRGNGREVDGGALVARHPYPEVAA